MSGRQMAWVWTGKTTPAKLTDRDKESIKRIVEAEIEKTTKLKGIVYRTQVKAGRVYLFYLYEPQIPEGAILTKPLIDGKYFELVLARITVYDKYHKECTLDWQRHNNEWMTIEKGSLEECIQIAEKSDWFQI
ncbi:hypothetical protein FACS189426_15870 [Bacteroidia bacterium]|nr:hypothetical protein FACS189426_15870 [Bacteroidia bacterium]